MNTSNLLKAILITLMSFYAVTTSAQNVGINNPTPHAKSLLDLTASDKGLLAPRMTEVQRTAMFPAADATAAGMLIYQTDNITGFYYYNGALWQPVNNEYDKWRLQGNYAVDPAVNFLGTLDYTPVPFRTFGTERMRITPWGAIGIGTTFPQAALEIASNSSTGYQNLKVKETGNDWARIGMYNDSSTKYWEMTAMPSNIDSVSHFNIYNSSTGNLVTVFGNGRVGIGQPFPAAQLSLSNTLGNKLSLYGFNANLYGFGVQNSLFQMFSSSNSSDIAFGYGNSLAFTENMRIKGNGNVGIGTATPFAKLQISSNSVAGTQNLRLKETGDDYARMGFYNDSTGKYFEITAKPNNVDSLSKFNVFHLGIGDVLSVYGSGRVGIRQGAPAAELSLSNTLGNKLTLYGTHGNMYGFGIQSGLFQVFSGHINSDIAFGYGNSLALVENMRIKGNGNVGIGTAAPLQRLHVNGNINIPQDSSYRIGNVPVVSTKGLYNSFLGYMAGYNNTSGTGNTFTGFQSGGFNTSGYFNVFNGWFSGLNNQDGSGNVFVGKESGKMNVSGGTNTFMGTASGLWNNGNDNVYVGAWAGQMGTAASSNTFIGLSAGNSNTGGNYNVALGSYANVGTTNTNAIAIGAGASVTTSNAMALGGTGTFAVNVGIGVTAPTATLEVNGYTKLGSDAPAIKVIKYTTTSPNTTGGYTEMPFTIPQEKIIAIQVLLEYATNQYLPPSYKGSNGYEFDYFTVNNRIGIQLSSTNSANAVSKPMKIVITYEQ